MKYVIGVVLLWAVIATVGQQCASQKNQDYEARAQRAESQVQNWVNLATTDSNVAAVALREADSIRRVNRGLNVRLAITKDSLNRQADSLLPLSPNICEPLAQLVEGYRSQLGRQEMVVAGLVSSGLTAVPGFTSTFGMR